MSRAELTALLREADRLLRVRLISEQDGSPTEDERALMKKIEKLLGPPPIPDLSRLSETEK